MYTIELKTLRRLVIELKNKYSQLLEEKAVEFDRMEKKNYFRNH